MEKKKILFTPLILLLLLTFLLTGCTSTPTAEPTKAQEVAPTETSKPEPTQPPPTEIPPTPNPNAWRERPELQSDYQGELVLWDWSFDPRNSWMEKYITEWEALHPGVTIAYEVLPESDVGSKLSTAIVAGTGPDFSVLNQEWRVEFQRNGLLEPLPKDLFPQAWRDLLFSTPFLEDENGDIYVTTVGAMGGELFWDKQLFADAGLTEEDVPKTWNELTDLAQTFTTWNEDGTLDTAGFGINGLNVWIWFDLVVQKGGHFYNEEVTEALWNESADVEAAQFVRDLFYEYQVTSPKVPWWGDLYCNGKAAMGYSYAWMPGWVAATCPEKFDDLGVAPLPTFDGAPAQGLQLQEDFLGVFAGTDPDKKALIWDFIHFLLLEDDDRVIELAVDFGVPPDRQDLVNAPALQESELLQIGAAVAPYSVRPGPLPMFGDHMSFLNTAFEEITLQDVPVQEALDSAVEQANLDLETSGKVYSSTEWKYVPPGE
jgi:multiple sugar transport system substrate-binding protein